MFKCLCRQRSLQCSKIVLRKFCWVDVCLENCSRFCSNIKANVFVIMRARLLQLLYWNAFECYVWTKRKRFIQRPTNAVIQQWKIFSLCSFVDQHALFSTFDCSCLLFFLSTTLHNWEMKSKKFSWFSGRNRCYKMTRVESSGAERRFVVFSLFRWETESRCATASTLTEMEMANKGATTSFFLISHKINFHDYKKYRHFHFIF